MSEDISKIQVLDDNTINKIAAGEVVERPSAIIREVVENAIDAGADDIRIDLELGGTKLIKIQDNGCGMNRTEAQLALQRHATSKIRSDSDLFNINTLGFRGEAIPSIASVSQFELLTRPHDTPAGTKVTVHGGKVISVDTAGCPAGTTITARNLFFNVPARQKFLRAHNTEYSHCLEAVVREMLIRPHIDIEVRHNRVSVLRSPKTDSLKSRAVSLLGKHWGQVIPISFESEYCSVEGLISPVGVHRKSAANSTYLYVNKRFVKDTAVRRAVSDAYQGIIPKKCYPLILLSVKVNPSQVDVNVHPAKTEVRFQQVLDVGQAITRGLRKALQEHGIRRQVTERSVITTPTADRPTSLPLFGNESQTVYKAPSTPLSPLPSLPPLPAVSQAQSVPLVSQTSNAVPGVIDPTDSISGGDEINQDIGERTVDPRYFPPSFYGFSETEFKEVEAPVLPLPKPSPMDALASPWPVLDGDEEVGLGEVLPVPSFADLKVIGQLKETYILCEGAGELVIIDQHAAHERITLDAVQRRRMDFIGGFQQLLTPILIELPPTQLARLVPLLPAFAEFGLEMDQFGGNTIRIRQIPVILEKSDWNQLVQDLVDDAMAGGKGAPVLERLETALATKACHGSIRAGRIMSKFEMLELLEELDAVDFGVCAHGRPVAIRITPAELEKQFHRT